MNISGQSSKGNSEFRGEIYSPTDQDQDNSANHQETSQVFHIFLHSHVSTLKRSNAIKAFAVPLHDIAISNVHRRTWSRCAPGQCGPGTRVGGGTARRHP